MPSVPGTAGMTGRGKVRRDFESPSSLITGRPSSYSVKVDFNCAARYILPRGDGGGLVRPYVAKFSPHELLLFALGGEGGHLSLVRGANPVDADHPVFPIEYSFPAAGDTIFDLAFLKSATNLMCAGSGDQQVHFIDTQKLRTVSSHEGHPDTVKVVTETRRGVLSGGSDGVVCLWDRRLKDPVFSLHLKNQASVSALVSPTDDIFVSGDGHGRVSAWDFRNGKVMMQLPLPATETRVSVSYLALAPDCSRMASLLTNNTLVVHRLDGSWRYTTRQWANIGAFYVRCCFSPDSKYILTGATNGAMCIFEAKRGRVPKVLLGHTDRTTCVDWCEDSFDHILSCGDDRVVQLWSSEYEQMSCDVEEEEELPEVSYVPEVAASKKQNVQSFYTLHHFLRDAE